MKNELDAALVKKYPLLYRDRYGDPKETLMCWGFCVGDGWYNIIDTLSYLLCADYIYKKESYDDIKEYYENGGKWPWKDGKEITPEEVEQRRLEMVEAEKCVPTVVQVKEKFGTLRFYVSRATDKQYNYITFAEAMSAVTCETCGKPGKLFQRGWHYTACNEHAKEEDLMNEEENDTGRE